MAVNLSPVGGAAAQFFTNTGAVLTGGKLYTYAAGTTTPAVTYTSSNGLTAWTNPIVLDAAGRVPGSGEIWLTDGINYKFVLKDSNDVLIATYDNISGINSNFVAYTNSQEIQTATAGQTVFTLTTMQYQPATNSLSVFVDGVNQYGPGAQYSYVETDSTTVTFNAGLHVGAEVKFTSTQQQGAGAADASQVTYDPPFTGSVATNVEDKLAQTVSVKDFGAVGDGVTDDTAAIQAALDATNESAYVPSGTYACNTSVQVTNGKQLILDRKATLIRKTALSASTDPVVYVLDSSSHLSGGTIYSENASPSGVVCLGHMSSTDDRNAWWWSFTDCNVYSQNNTGDIGVNVPSGQVTYTSKANYFGRIDGINIYGGDIGLLLAEQANAHNVSNIQFWHQQTRGLQLRGAYGNNINNLFFHDGAAAGMYSVHIANKTASIQESTFNNIIGFVSETGNVGDKSLVIDSNASQNRVIFGSNVNGGWVDNNGTNVVIASTAYNKPTMLGEAKVYADASANALSVLGRSSDNIGNVLFKSNDNITTYGYLQSRGNGQLWLVSNGTNPVSIYTNGNECFRSDTNGIAGVVVKTPDGTKSYRIAVDNSGNLTSTLV